MIRDIFLERYPQIDLHGDDRETARMRVKDFIEENIILRNEVIVIVHGKGEGILKKVVHELLKDTKSVLEYKTDNFNDGCTVVKLKISLE